jgi:hypothetical protein
VDDGDVRDYARRFGPFENLAGGVCPAARLVMLPA